MEHLERKFTRGIAKLPKKAIGIVQLQVALTKNKKT